MKGEGERKTAGEMWARARNKEKERQKARKRERERERKRDSKRKKRERECVCVDTAFINSLSMLPHRSRNSQTLEPKPQSETASTGSDMSCDRELRTSKKRLGLAMRVLYTRHGTMSSIRLAIRLLQ